MRQGCKLEKIWLFLRNNCSSLLKQNLKIKNLLDRNIFCVSSHVNLKLRLLFTRSVFIPWQPYRLSDLEKRLVSKKSVIKSKNKRRLDIFVSLKSNSKNLIFLPNLNKKKQKQNCTVHCKSETSNLNSDLLK